MKLTNASKGLIILSLAIGSCTYKPEDKLVQGYWQYEDIKAGDSALISISDNDIMTLRSDSTFEYHIESVQKHMYGKWTYSDHTLHLKYNNPDTIRHFSVDLLSNHQLIMHEGDVSFKFSRIKTD
ncbi:MAG: lipocalin family protein [Bacteroidetes bacterium]|nr:lipocalin family protein [Bacteroidota bacterium]